MNGFVHDIDPLILDLFGFKVWYYGAAYAIGFLGIHLWLLWRRRELGWTHEEVLDLSILWASSVLIVGHLFDVFVYEWAYYREHPLHILTPWVGGYASHGVLLGALLGALLFATWRKKRFLVIADEVVIPAALFFGLGRIANFINGQINGTLTDVWWAVKFPGIEGFRHPVALYEALKNLAIIPILLLVRRHSVPGQGKLLAHFIFWYGFLRLFTDYFRTYGRQVLGIGTGQYYNLLMALIGFTLILWFSRRSGAEAAEGAGATDVGGAIEEAPGGSIGLWIRRVIFVALLLVSLTIPSSWTKAAELWLEGGAAAVSDSSSPAG